MKIKTLALGAVLTLMMTGGSFAEEYHTSTEDIQKRVYDMKSYEEDIDEMMNFLHAQIGKPYVWGATGNDFTSYDCSSLVQQAYKQIKIDIARVSYMQALEGVEIALKDIQKGDIVCFVTSNRNNGKVTHVGIYVGDGDFIHAKSSKHGVVKQRLSDYYAKLTNIRRIKGALYDTNNL